MSGELRSPNIRPTTLASVLSYRPTQFLIAATAALIMGPPIANIIHDSNALEDAAAGSREAAGQTSNAAIAFVAAQALQHADRGFTEDYATGQLALNFYNIGGCESGSTKGSLMLEVEFKKPGHEETDDGRVQRPSLTPKDAIGLSVTRIVSESGEQKVFDIRLHKESVVDDLIGSQAGHSPVHAYHEGEEYSYTKSELAPVTEDQQPGHLLSDNNVGPLLLAAIDASEDAIQGNCALTLPPKPTLTSP